MSVMVRCKNPDCQVSFSAPPLITDSVLHKRPETVGQEMAYLDSGSLLSPSR
jgi:hypothetical protein